MDDYPDTHVWCYTGRHDSTPALWYKIPNPESGTPEGSYDDGWLDPSGGETDCSPSLLVDRRSFSSAEYPDFRVTVEMSYDKLQCVYARDLPALMELLSDWSATLLRLRGLSRGQDV